MKIEGIFIQNGDPFPSGFQGCGTPPDHHSTTCIMGTFVDWVGIGEEYTGGDDETEVAVIRLVDPEYEDRPESEG